jgi:hypothetical protein
MTSALGMATTTDRFNATRASNLSSKKTAGQSLDLLN